MAATCCLFFIPLTRYAFFILMCAWVSYLSFVQGMPGEFYFAFVGLLDLFIGWSFNKRYRIASYLSYSLIFIGLFGFYCWWYGLSEFYYELLYAIIEVIRIISLIARGLLDGVNKNKWRCGGSISKYLLVRYVDFDGGKSCGKMFKNTPINKAQE